MKRQVACRGNYRLTILKSLFTFNDTIIRPMATFGRT
jgi:hypothetical protein